MAAVVTAIQSSHQGITLNVAPQQSATHQDQVQTALNAGTGPDLFQAQTRPKLDVQADAGQLLDLTDKVDTSAWTQVAKDSAHGQEQDLGGTRAANTPSGSPTTSPSSRRPASPTSRRPGRR